MIKADKRRLLILKPSALGDIVHTFPLLTSLRKSFPAFSIFWGVKDKFSELLEGHPYIDQIILWRDGKLWQFVKEIRRRRFDIVIELQGLFRTGLIAYLSGAPQRWGFSQEESKEWQFMFLNRRVKTKSSHVVEKNLEFAEKLGAKREVEFLIPEREDAKKYIEENLKKALVLPEDKLIALSPGGGWANKIWSDEKFANLGKRLTLKKNWRVLILWGPGEFKKAISINEIAEGKLVVAPPTGIPQLVSLLKKCSMVIGGDTGPLHLAAALNVPVVGLYGPTPPERNGPYTQKKEVIYHNLDCSPCWRKPCKTRDCMDSIEVEEVMEKVEHLASRFF
ncbi:MAG TPA: lipopolysaccharide heptosyltransferase II [Candidatus Omnitrophica bacterium]|nr:lipopolysaccharide heptosyltransferase II [Candidatus Omnitrophota bacterium]